MLLVLILLNLAVANEELARTIRGFDPNAFKTFIQLGKILGDFGVENLEKNVKNTIGLIYRNIFIFYYLLISIILLNFIYFSMMVFFKMTKKSFKYPIKNRSCDVNSEFEYVTNDREYFPAKISELTLTPETYV